MEAVGSLEEQHRCHGASEREALDSDLVPIDIRQRLEPFRPSHKVFYLIDRQSLVYHIKTFAAIVSGSARVHGYLDYAHLAVPLVVFRWPCPAVPDHRGIRPSIYIHMNRIFLLGVEPARILDHSR